MWREFGILWLASAALGCSSSIDQASGAAGGANAGGGRASNTGSGAGGAGAGTTEIVGSTGWVWPVDSTLNANVASVAVDSAGNIVFAGLFNGVLAFPSPGATCVKSCGFIAKLDPSGHLLWTHSYLGNDQLEIDHITIAIGPHDEVVVGGEFLGMADFGAGLVGAGPQEAFLVAYDAVGTRRWSWHFTGSGLIIGADVAVGSEGDIVMVGMSGEYIDFGLGNLAGGAFVVKFDEGGVAKWNRSFPRTHYNDQPGDNRAVALTPVGDIVFETTLDLTQEVDFGCGMVPLSNLSPMVLVRLDADGVCKFSQPLQMLASDAVRVAHDGSVLVGGMSDGAMLPHGGYDSVFRRFNEQGTLLVDKTFGDTAAQSFNSLAIDRQSGNVALVGYNAGALDFGGGPVAAGSFTVVLTPNGEQVGPSLAVGGGDVEFAPNGIVVGGIFTGTAHFGGAPVQAEGMTAGFIGDFRWP